MGQLFMREYMYVLTKHNERGKSIILLDTMHRPHQKATFSQTLQDKIIVVYFTHRLIH